MDINDCPKLTELTCSQNQQLTSLRINNCPRLKEVRCVGNHQLTNFTITNCPRLEELNLSDNQLNNADFIKNLNPRSLTILCVGNNDFPPQDLLCFAKFINLEKLWIGNGGTRMTYRGERKTTPIIR